MLHFQYVFVLALPKRYSGWGQFSSLPPMPKPLQTANLVLSRHLWLTWTRDKVRNHDGNPLFGHSLNTLGALFQVFEHPRGHSLRVPRTPPFSGKLSGHSPKRLGPKIGSPQPGCSNLVVCRFYAEAIFCAHARPFALFCRLCARLRSFACFCVRTSLERLCVNISEKAPREVAILDVPD